MKRSAYLVGLAFLCSILAPGSSVALQDDAAAEAARILKASGVRGGLIVHVGSGDGTLTAALAGEQFRVHGLDTSAERVAKARARVRSKGLYGPVSLDVFDGRRLPYIDNLVNLVVSEDPGRVSDEEILRVLAPEGVAYVKRGVEWAKTVKPRPANIDEWTHYLYDPSNNAVADDEVVGPPRRMQWVGSPRYSRHHDKMSSLSALVSARGRVFYIFDEAPRLSALLAPDWHLVARDAFNGTILWKRRIKKWHTHLFPLKSGPAQLPRRLVASGDRVYVTLNIDGPVMALDAATGETVRTYEGTAGAEEIVFSDGVLYAVVRTVDQAQLDRMRRRGASWESAGVTLVAVRAASGKTLWTRDEVALPNTMAIGATRVVYHNGESVVALDRESGKEVWRSTRVARGRQIRSYYAPTLVLYKDVVLFSGGETAANQRGGWYRTGKDSMTALDAESGKVLWSADHPPSGYRSAEDLMVVDGLVWTGETTSGRAEGLFTGRDPRTGKVERKFEPDVSTYWFHHRCHRGKATKNYLIMSRAGIEFVDVKKQTWNTNHFVRGACLYGVMPANGLVYAPQHPCACYLEAKLYGFNALAPAPAEPVTEIALEQRLVKGPAFESGAEPKAAAEDWPTFRHDAARTGHASTAVPANVSKAWTTKIGGRLTSPVVAAGKLFVASREAHSVHALDAATGERAWDFTAGGRVDSPPTWYRGRVYFGSADGWIYCLRASDGALAWRFLAGLADRRMMYFEQLESLWPVHGSVLIQDGVLYAVAGRSMFLDGGLRLWRLDPVTGRVLTRTVLGTREAETGKDLQDFVSWLNMPTGLPDVLSSDGKFVYMRSQPFDLEGKRLPLKAMPRKADADQGAPDPVQGVEHAHLFSPTGYLDDSYWHRTYWLYGTMWVSGWQGYYRAGKSAPAGRLLVSDDRNIYGFGRKPKYWRWTVPIEHHLFASAKKGGPAKPQESGTKGGTRVRVAKSASLNPANKGLTVEAWVKTLRADGVVLARGGSAHGYSLHVRRGRPVFAVRANGKVGAVTARTQVLGRWAHLAAVMTEKGELKLYVDGRIAATGKAPSIITADPAEAMEIGADEGSTVAESVPFTGSIDEVRIYSGVRSLKQIGESAKGQEAADREGLVLAFGFEDGKASDASGNRNDGQVEGPTAVPGKVGRALKFDGGPPRVPGFDVTYSWTEDLPLYARAMVLVGGKLFVAGPDDLIDEEQANRQMNDPAIQKQLAEQLEAWTGKRGAILRVVTASDGTKEAEIRLDTPPVFDGMIAAQGRLFVCNMDGTVTCLKGR